MFLATATRSSRATVKKWCNKEHWNPASSKSKLISEQESCSDQLRGALAQPCRRDPCASSCHWADSRLAVNHRTAAHVNETQTGSEQTSASTTDDTVKLLLRRKMDGGPRVTCRWLPCPVLPFARVEFSGTGNSTRRVTYHIHPRSASGRTCHQEAGRRAQTENTRCSAGHSAYYIATRCLMLPFLERQQTGDSNNRERLQEVDKQGYEHGSRGEGF